MASVFRRHHRLGARLILFAGSVVALFAVLALALVPYGLPAFAVASEGPTADWPAYGDDPGGSHYSPLTQISLANVANLRVAWTYHTGDVSDGTKTSKWKSRFETTPILVDGTLYLESAFNRVIALDPETGAERWTYDPHLDLSRDYGDPSTRGVSTWLDTTRDASRACRRRIFVGTLDARLIALDAKTGVPCADFGQGGQVDLFRDVPGAGPPDVYAETSAPAIVDDLVVVGAAVNDNQRTDTKRGIVRAFDARTGAERWRFDPIPTNPADPAAPAWQGDSAAHTGAGGVWSTISVDPARDLVFLPTESASPDFYGGERLGRDDYADSLVALRGSTGQVVWHFQVVHHDLWDYDVPAQPTLVTVHRGGQDVPAVVVATKMGHLFILNRETGEPLFPVEERPVPASDVPGEQAWPTQPFPTSPAPLGPERLTPDEAWGLTPWDRNACRQSIAALRNEGIFTPPSFHGTIIFPGLIGGANWSGVAADPQHGLLLVPTNRLAMAVWLVPRADLAAERAAHPNADFAPMVGTPYGVRRENLVSPLGLPCNPPPWGTLAAIDLATGEKRWEVPLGALQGKAPGPVAAGLGTIGMVNLGGALVTGGGLVFIGAGFDDELRAFDVQAGKELWQGHLPAGGQAMPMTYRLSEDGKQYVVIAAGGSGNLGTTLGDSVVAFTLGDKEELPWQRLLHALGW